MLCPRGIAGAALAIAATVFAATTARAQAPSPRDDVAAEALFEDARNLVAAGKYAEACPKFADSQRLGPSPSTLLNLANCWEKLGRTATAWATYREAASAANAVGRKDYLLTAQRRADGLAPKLARLTVTIGQPVAGLQVKRDGIIVDAAEWGTAIPVDVGPHSVEASAPGRKAWAVAIQVAQDGAQASVTIPPLEEAAAEAVAVPASSAPPAPLSSPPPSAPESLAPPTPSGGGTQRVAAVVIAAAGVVGIGIGTAFAVVALNKFHESTSNGQCPKDPNICDQTGVNERNDARQAGDIATAALGIGAAAIVSGGIVWFTAAHGSRPASAAFAVAPTLGGLVARGAF